MASNKEPTECKNGNKFKSLVEASSPGPRRNLGRSARRRRKKLLEIQRAEEELLLGSSSSQQQELPTKRNSCSNSLNSSNQIIPSDRDKIWPGVQERRLDSLEKEAPRLTNQLGYIPGNAIKIAARVSDIPVLRGIYAQSNNYMPVILQLYPIVVRDVHPGGKAGSRKFKSRKRTRTTTSDIEVEKPSNNTKKNDSNDKAKDSDNNNNQNDDDDDDDLAVEPFPTLYWLTHPLLRTLVSKLELCSVGTKLEIRLKADVHAMASMERAHKAYGQERHDLLTSHDMSFIQARNWVAAFEKERGVAGIRNYASIKCLHAHVAHFLSGGKGSSDNVVGKWVMEEVAEMILSKSEDEKQSDKSQEQKA